MTCGKPTITGRQAVLASGHYLATSAGMKMFAKGGNAVDAGVAAGFALAVLKPQQNSLGGECPILIYDPGEGKVAAISGQGVAPAAATVEWFREHGISAIPDDGLLGATVPGMFGAYATALMKYGSLTLEDACAPAIELAGEGFPVYSGLSDRLAGLKDKFMREWPSSAEVFLPGGRVPRPGELLRQPALAHTFRKLVECERENARMGREAAIQSAIELFYKGAVADEILAFARNTPVLDKTGKAHTTLLQKGDFKSYRTRVEEPVFADYKNYRVFKCGPWTQGPVFLQQLKLLKGFDLKGFGHNTADAIHVVTECAKLAMADRDRYYGDPNFSDIPLNRLLSSEYAAERRKKIDMDKACITPLWSDCGRHDDTAYSGDTTHLDVADRSGLMMSATPSGGWIPTSPVIPALGFPLGTRAQMFNFKTGHPNCIAPGKRPRTTLTPSLAFRDGKPWMAFGTPGGDMQDQWALHFFLNLVEYGMGLQEAAEAPSFHTTHLVGSFYPHEAGDGTIYIEDGIGRDVLYALQDKGHKLNLTRPGRNGEVCGVRYNFENRLIEGAASPKLEGNAYAFGW